MSDIESIQRIHEHGDSSEAKSLIQS